MPDESIQLELDRPRKARFTLDSIMAIEKESGRSLSDSENGSVTYMCLMVWSAVRTYQTDLEFERFRSEIRDVTFPQLAEAIRALQPQLGKVMGVPMTLGSLEGNGTGTGLDGSVLAHAVSGTPSSTT